MRDLLSTNIDSLRKRAMSLGSRHFRLVILERSLVNQQSRALTGLHERLARFGVSGVPASLEKE
jgi:hypothetical protein